MCYWYRNIWLLLKQICFHFKDLTFQYALFRHVLIVMLLIQGSLLTLALWYLKKIFFFCFFFSFMFILNYTSLFQENKVENKVKKSEVQRFLKKICPLPIEPISDTGRRDHVKKVKSQKEILFETSNSYYNISEVILYRYLGLVRTWIKFEVFVIAKMYCHPIYCMVVFFY